MHETNRQRKIGRYKNASLNTATESSESLEKFLAKSLILCYNKLNINGYDRVVSCYGIFREGGVAVTTYCGQVGLSPGSRCAERIPFLQLLFWGAVFSNPM